MRVKRSLIGRLWPLTVRVGMYLPPPADQPATLPPPIQRGSAILLRGRFDRNHQLRTSHSTAEQSPPVTLMCWSMAFRPKGGFFSSDSITKVSPFSVCTAAVPIARVNSVRIVSSSASAAPETMGTNAMARSRPPGGPAIALRTVNAPNAPALTPGGADTFPTICPVPSPTPTLFMTFVVASPERRVSSCNPWTLPNKLKTHHANECVAVQSSSFPLGAAAACPARMPSVTTIAAARRRTPSMRASLHPGGGVGTPSSCSDSRGGLPTMCMFIVSRRC